MQNKRRGGRTLYRVYRGYISAQKENIMPTTEKPGLTRDAIKYLAIFTMLLNHIANVLLPENTILWEVLVDIGYFTAITMCYFLVE